jgi:hypothetical protein
VRYIKETAMVTDKWKILQLTPAAGWVARFQSGAAPASETALASWALVDDGTRTFMVGMIAVASDPACAFAPRDERFIGYFYRGTEVPLAAELPAIQKVAKTGSAWKSTTKPDAA